MWNDQNLAIVYPDDVAERLKRHFAAEWARQYDNPFEAARLVEDHLGKAHFIATNWINDEYVLSEVARLRAELGPISHVPTKEQFAAEMYKKAGEAKTHGDQLSYYQFFAKIMSYVEPANIRIKGDADNPIVHRHVIKELTDDELARIATGGSNGTAKT